MLHRRARTSAWPREPVSALVDFGGNRLERTRIADLVSANVWNVGVGLTQPLFTAVNCARRNVRPKRRTKRRSRATVKPCSRHCSRWPMQCARSSTTPLHCRRETQPRRKRRPATGLPAPVTRRAGSARSTCSTRSGRRCRRRSTGRARRPTGSPIRRRCFRRWRGAGPMAGGVIGWTTLARAGCCRLHAGHRMSGALVSAAFVAVRIRSMPAGDGAGIHLIGTANKTGPKAGFIRMPQAALTRAWHLKRWIRPTPRPIWFCFEPAPTPSPIDVVALTMPPVRPLIVLPLACWYASTAYRPVRFDRL